MSTSQSRMGKHALVFTWYLKGKVRWGECSLWFEISTKSKIKKKKLEKVKEEDNIGAEFKRPVDKLVKGVLLIYQN